MALFDNISKLFSPDTGPARNAFIGSKPLIQKGAKKAAGQVKTGAEQALGYEQQALPAWQTLFGQGQGMVQGVTPVAEGALGLGSPADIAAGKAAWESSIPYSQFNALLPDIYETALRRGGMTGQTGNIPIDTSNRAMQALNQFYPGWQSNLMGLMGQGYGLEQQGATGQTGVFGSEAAIAEDRAKALAALASNKWNTLSGLKSGVAPAVSQAEMGGASNSLNALFGIGQLLASMGGGVGSMFGGGSTTGAAPLTGWNPYVETAQ